ncbi:hypothetical protein C5B85_14385 [Pseudoclavibacter sp. AY1F1]|uniref:hypothetical protein n=1 Tax=Pseudoclavibacter sp. AY1F1 TaxID=2080583 RepID=UPI000CE869D3|nr:hypothetical protein [Pseudoclavibacter sp. AY1F1]PPF43140.1 hypothetical protein C5B85_14385 [Pseudoclavibacter sp. AY1F1]
MFTTDFSKAPIQGQAEALVITEGRSASREGVIWRQRFTDRRVSGELLLFESVERAREVAAGHDGRTKLLLAETRGYSNGIWRADPEPPPGEMAHNPHFAPVSKERAEGRTPPLVAEPTRKPRKLTSPIPPPTHTIFDTASMFVGATRYTTPLAWAVTGRIWGQMTGKMRRMPDYCWHGIYWEAPWTLGTLANFSTRDALLRFARMPEHTHLMQWIVKDTRNANAGFIRLFASEEELASVESSSANGADGPGPGVVPGAVPRTDAQSSALAESAPLPRSNATSGLAGTTPKSRGIEVRRVRSELEFLEFVELPGRVSDPSREVPVLESTLRSWWKGPRSPRRDSAAHEPEVELLLAYREGTPLARAVTHTSAALDAKLDSRLQLFGAVTAADADALGAIIGAVEARAVKAGRQELLGPVTLLPNQVGGVITSGFGERGFVEGAWNPDWVPAAYEGLGFTTWNESATWLARLEQGRLGQIESDAFTAPTDAELKAAGIVIEHASRLRFPREVARQRELVNAAFARLPYYTQISPAQMREATSGLIAIIDPSIWVFALDEKTRKPLGFLLCVPDVTRIVQRSSGRIGLRQLLEIWRQRKEPREAVLTIQGTIPEARGRGISTLLGRTVGEALIEGGYTALRSTYIGRDNPASARQLSRMGGQELHETVFYRRAVGAGPEGNATHEGEQP